ncbi:MAG TPA: transporter substrate-binding domain-containing protein [Chryseosolibacter sp.]|nr:transporter substrate-binding domain-containing protein [Chryseosolibacter sp.]
MKCVLLLAFIACANLVFAQGYSGDSWANVKAAKSGTVSLAYVETPSFVYKDKSGNLTGICVDIMNDFVKWVNENKGVKLTSRFLGDGSSFRGMFEGTKSASGGVIGLGNITITEERKREVKFSQPFITNFAILTTQTTVPTLAKLEDLPKTFPNFTAYTAKGTLNEKRVQELKTKYYPGMKVSLQTTSQEVLEKVFADPAGVAYLDLAFYIEAVQMRKPIKRHPVGDKAAEQFGFIMPLGSDWGPVLDEFFKSNGGYLNSKEYKSILIKHLGEAGVKLLQSGTR